VIAVFDSDKMRVFGPSPLPAITFTPFTFVTAAILYSPIISNGKLDLF